MGDFFKIEPFVGRCAASVMLPGSKSITNRAMILSALLGKEVNICGALFSRDTLIMSDCLRKIGVGAIIDEEMRTVKITPSQELKKSAKFYVGNAGTAARFFVAFAALVDGGEYEFDSDEEMKLRPMKGLLAALEEQGASFEFKGKEWAFPFKMKTRGLAGGELPLNASASSQILSALLMVGGFAKTPLRIELEGSTVSRPFVDMTISVMKDFGLVVNLECGAKGAAYSFGNDSESLSESVAKGEYNVEPDATAASYFAVLPYVAGGACFLSDVKLVSLQGDSKFLNLLSNAGLLNVSEVGGGVLVYKDSKRTEIGADSLEFDFCDISDTFPTFAAIAPITGKKVSITGISHTRFQECDRVATVAVNLREMGVEVVESDDSITIMPAKITNDALKKTVKIRTEFDHRMAMAFSILGAYPLFGSRPWIDIESPDCVSKTYPDFFSDLSSAHCSSDKFRIVAVDGGAAVGKSSVSRACANVLNYMHVDTGAHYRTLTYGLLHSSVKSDDAERVVASALKQFQMGSFIDGGSARMTLNGETIEDSLIRSGEINANVSKFAAMATVRNFVKEYQVSMADFARTSGFGGLIMEGRDIGNVIFPKADVKIFLDADEATRAARRAKEGIEDSIGARDKIDRNRKVAPLKCAVDACVIDTSHLTKDEVVSRALALIVSA